MTGSNNGNDFAIYIRKYDKTKRWMGIVERERTLSKGNDSRSTFEYLRKKYK